MFCDGTHDAADWGFLKCISTDGRCGNLTTNNNNGNRICHAITNWGYTICGAWPGCHYDYANFPRCARIAGGHKACALFISWNNQGYGIFTLRRIFLVVSENCIKCWKYSATTISKNRVYAMISKHLHDHFRTIHLSTG